MIALKSLDNSSSSDCSHWQTFSHPTHPVSREYSKRTPLINVGNVNKLVKWADETKPTYADIAPGASGRRNLSPRRWPHNQIGKVYSSTFNALKRCQKMNDTNTIRDSSSRSLACSPLSAAILKRRFLRFIIALLTSAVGWNQLSQPVDLLDSLWVWIPSYHQLRKSIQNQILMTTRILPHQLLPHEKQRLSY